jgi:ADP-ribose pyrophosphatase YjhB (NUDIX family)
MTGIQLKAVGLFQQSNQMLVQESTDPANGEHFCRPLGGKIEFGERAAETLHREVREELGAEICDLRLLTVLENLFTYAGEPRHEMIFVFEARFVEPRFYEQTELVWLEETTKRVKVHWKQIDELRSGHPPFYPAAILELLKA